MATTKRMSFQHVMVAIAAIAIAVALAPLTAWAAPAGGGDSLSPAGSSLTAQEGAADPIDVYMTISNQGVLALAHQAVTVTDLDEDGAFSYDEALQAAHEKYCEGGYETTMGAYGMQVIKLWGVESTANVFYQNDELCLSGVGDQQVSAGDDLVAGVMVDTAMWSDRYTYFTKKAITVNAGKEFALNLNAIGFDASFQPVTFKAANVQVGTWANGKFKKLPNVKTDKNGKATLSFEEPGVYIVSAGGTVDDTDAGLSNCPIVAPYCEVTVVGKNTMKVSAVAKEDIPAATYGKAKTIAAKKAIEVTGAQGAVTYEKVSGDKKITVAENGKITIKKGIAAGEYKVKIAVTAAGTEIYKPATKNVTVTLTVNKAKNTMQVTSQKTTIKLAEVAKKNVTVAPLTVKNAKGSKAFAVTKWVTPKAKKCFTVNAKNGKVTAKKGTPKGTYKFNVKVTAKGNDNYKASKTTKTVVIKVG